MTLALLFAAGWHPDPTPTSTALSWLALAAFYVAMFLFAVEMGDG